MYAQLFTKLNISVYSVYEGKGQYHNLLESVVLPIMSTFKKYMALFFLSLGGGTIYIVPYFKYSYYDQLMAATGLNNYQLGMTLTVYATIALISYLPGGLIADKFKAKTLFAFSMITTGLLTFWYAMLPGYKTLLVIHALMSVTSVLTFWSAYLKGVRALGTKEEQGKMFGISDSIRSIASAVVSFILLAVIGKASTDAVGVANSLYLMGIVYIAIGVLTYFLMPNESESQSSDENEEVEKLSLQSIKKVLKMPAVWLIAFNVFCWFAAYGTLTFAVPYLSQGFDLTASMASTVGIIRMYIIAIFAAPIAGFIADKIKSPSKVLIYLGVIGTVLTAIFIIIPTRATFMMLMVVVTLAVGAVIAAARGIYFATMAETRIPLYVTGTATGIISIICYMPDLFMQPMIGYWIDKFGLLGYKYSFIWMTGILILSIVTAVLIRRNALKAEKEAAKKKESIAYSLT